jgi:hypothetical protein
MKAFPTATIFHDEIVYTGGMDLRDYFAAKAMQGDFISGIHVDDFKDCAIRAYEMADAMMQARGTK